MFSTFVHFQQTLWWTFHELVVLIFSGYHIEMLAVSLAADFFNKRVYFNMCKTADSKPYYI